MKIPNKCVGCVYIKEPTTKKGDPWCNIYSKKVFNALKICKSRYYKRG